MPTVELEISRVCHQQIVRLCGKSENKVMYIYIRIKMWSNPFCSVETFIGFIKGSFYFLHFLISPFLHRSSRLEHHSHIQTLQSTQSVNCKQ